jgi:hypothetical protein
MSALTENTGKSPYSERNCLALPSGSGKCSDWSCAMTRPTKSVSPSLAAFSTQVRSAGTERALSAALSTLQPANILPVSVRRAAPTLVEPVALAADLSAPSMSSSR